VKPDRPQTKAATGLPKTSTDARCTSVLKKGRIRICDHLIISLNRSWQVEHEPDAPPASEFKSMAPLAFRDTDDKSDHYLAAIAAHDAYWLGFETEADKTFAVTIDIDGINALTHQPGPSTKLQQSPPNHLLIPDQPWFDTLARPGGEFVQMIPHYGPNADKPGAEVRVTVFSLAGGSIITPPPPDDPQPLYADNDAEQSASPHLWTARAFQDVLDLPDPSGQITFHIVLPETFQRMTGQTLDLKTFIDEGPPPEPFDPFQ
jgi:hypothetical protein